MLDWIAGSEDWELVWKIVSAAATIGGAIGALVLAYTFFSRRHRQQQQQQTEDLVKHDRDRQRRQSQDVAGIRDDIRKIADSLVADAAATSLPDQTEQVAEAVTAASEDAEAGDDRMTRAFALLQAGEPAEAVALFRAVAEEKTAVVDRDRKQAAAAWRHLGAIAGLADPAQARLAYAKAVELDPSDAESQLMHGFLQNDAGQLAAATAAFHQVLALANQGTTEHQLAWARTGNGDVLREQGNLPAALESYRADMAIAKRLAEADPANAQWQRDLSVSNERIGDVLRDQGDLPAALESFRTSMALRQPLAEADPSNAQWQRDLAISHGRVAHIEALQGQIKDALSDFRRGRSTIATLAAESPDNAVLVRDLAYFDAQIAEIEN